MKKFIPFYIGLRYLRAKRKTQFISFISFVSMIGMLLGVAVLIVVLSVMNGFDYELRSRILGMVPHVKVISREPMKDWQSVATDIEEIAGVTAIAPFTELQGMLSNQGSVEGALIKGISPAHETAISIVDDNMLEGARISSLEETRYGIILGKRLADKLLVKKGDKVTLIIPEATVSAAGVIPTFKRFTVTGLFEVGAEMDAALAYIHVRDAAKLKRMSGSVQGLEIKTADLFESRQTAQLIVNRLGRNYYAYDWSMTHGSLFQAIQLEKKIMGLLLFIIVAVAVFNIVSSLVMLVNDKRSDIAVLRTIGASPRTVMGVFVVQGSAIGLIGTFIGVVLGVLFALNLTDIAAWVESLSGRPIFEAYIVNFLPSRLNWMDVVVVGSASCLMGFLATLYPAWQASKIMPAEALRYD